jgi:hypothetical protein
MPQSRMSTSLPTSSSTTTRGTRALASRRTRSSSSACPRASARSYRIWEEGRIPSLAVEIASQEGWQELLKQKKDLYERIGVEEYVVFDPDGEFIQPRLQGFRLENDRYRAIPLEADGSLVSMATGLKIQPEGTNLRLIDIATGERFPWAEEEAAARRALEEELARLREELERRDKSK